LNALFNISIIDTIIHNSGEGKGVHHVKTMPVTDFKAHALKVLGEVAETREPVVVTKRGKPLAEIVPFAAKRTAPGRLAEALVFENDIVSPIGKAERSARR
jgi:prevent-host-death family protein